MRKIRRISRMPIAYSLIFLPYLGKADDNRGDIYRVGVGHGLPSLHLATAM